MSTITGTSAADRLVGTADDDVISGLAGDDFIDGRGGADRLDGGEGDDTFLVTEVRQVGGVSVTGLIDGGTGIDALDLTAINDPSVTLRVGDSSRQTLVLFAGQDQYRLANIERILFGAGTHSYDAREATVRFVDLGAGDDFFFSAVAGTTVRGGDGSDSFRFDTNLFLYGDAGDDTFTVSVGASSDGLIDGGSGIDTVRLNGRDSDAVIDLAAGTARYGSGTFAISGIENVFASNGVVRGDASNNLLVRIPDTGGVLTLEGGGGDDVLIGTSAVDRLFGGDGDDLIEGRGSGADTLDGGPGIDTVAVITSSSVSLAVGTIVVGTTTQTIIGFENVRGSAAGDTIVGDNGANRLDGGFGNDLIRGGGGSDTIIGGGDADVLYGDEGDDLLLGETGNDELNGGDGNDTLSGGGGDDQLLGGAGSDVAAFSRRRADTSFTYSNGTITANGADGIDVTTGIEAFQFDDGLFDVRSDGTVANAARVLFAGTAAADVVRSGDSNDVLAGGAGNDSLDAGVGSDRLDGGTGNDLLTGGAGDDAIDGGSGTDTAVFLAASAQVTFSYVDGAIVVDGPDGRDVLRGVEQLQFSDRVLDVGTDGRVMLSFNGVAGTAGANTLTGTAGSDIITGNAGNDTLRGQAASDRLDGGDGVDTAVYSGVRRQYGADSAAVRGGSEGGTDTLVSIEQLQFVDGILSFDVNGIPAQVMRLYDAALDRLPDQAGLEVQVQAIASGANTLAGLAQAFIASPEFQDRYGNLSDRAFVEQLYRFCLNREGDEPGIQAQVQALQGGLSRGQLLINFSESAEHRTLTQATLSAGLWVPDAEALLIARLYDATFDRLPDAAGLAGQLAALDSGVTLLQLAANFAASAEFQARYGNLSDRAFVEQLYRFCLDREGDEPGIVAQVQALQSGLSRAQLLLNFSESAEHVSLTAPLWSGGIRTVDTPFSGSPDISDAVTKAGDHGAQTLVLAEAESEAKADQAQVLPQQPMDDIYDPPDLGLKTEEMDAFVLPALPDDIMHWIPTQTPPDPLDGASGWIDSPMPGRNSDEGITDAFVTDTDGVLHRTDHHDWI